MKWRRWKKLERDGKYGKKLKGSVLILGVVVVAVVVVVQVMDGQ